MSCIVLAGGKGSRLGHDKTEVIVGQKSLFQRVLHGISFLKGEIIVVTSQGDPFPWLINYPEPRIVADIHPGKGPLAGIFAGLKASQSLYNLVVACDMPFLNQALLSYMVRLPAGFDVVIPRLDDMIEPLHAVYSRDCLASIKNMIEQDNLSVNRLLKMVKVRYVEASEIDRFDPEHLSFFNVNTRADLKIAWELTRRIDITDDKC